MTYLATWPDTTISVVSARDEVELFEQLDECGPPLYAEIYKLPKYFSIRTSLDDGCFTGWEDNQDELDQFHFSKATLDRVFPNGWGTPHRPKYRTNQKVTKPTTKPNLI
jgi:hypothetical protein